MLPFAAGDREVVLEAVRSRAAEGRSLGETLEIDPSDERLDLLRLLGRKLARVEVGRNPQVREPTASDDVEAHRDYRSWRPTASQPAWTALTSPLSLP